MYLCAVEYQTQLSMPRQERLQSATGIYHVMLRGINKQDIFEDDGIGGDSPRMSSGQKMDHENRPQFSEASLSKKRFSLGYGYLIWR